MPGTPTTQSSEKQSHVEAPSTSEISRRTVSAPASGQLIKVASGKSGEIDLVVWDEIDWTQIPMHLTKVILELRRELRKTSASRIVLSVVLRGR